MKRLPRFARLGAVFIVLLTMIVPSASASHLTGPTATYTTTDDFNEGSKINVVTDNDEVKLDDQTRAFNFIWVAVSTKGTIVKIDTLTGEVLGEYLTAPEGMATDPSRTTVDKNGNVWVTNRQEFGFVFAGEIAPGLPAFDQEMGSVAHVGLVENGQCVDRNGNGMIDTSTGLDDIRGWSNNGGADILGGVSTADDECILHYTRVRSTGARHVSVDANNDVWVSGSGLQNFDLIDGDSGQIIRQEDSVGYGGYGGLIDSNGVIWSARPLLRWDTALPLSGPNGGNWTGYDDIDSYGLCIDSGGNVWNTDIGNGFIRKYAPNGDVLGSFWHGHPSAQGCVVGLDDDVWVAHAFFGEASVGHLKNDGTFVGNVAVPSGPSGVAVDAAGKIWSTNFDAQTISRIDPNAGPIGADGATRVGEVEFTSVELGGNLYNYSDMTGSTLTGEPDNGTWTVVHDSGNLNTEWGTVSWNADVFGDGSLTVTAASSHNGVSFSAPVVVTSGSDLSLPNGRYLRVSVNLSRSTDGDSPILYDLTIEDTKSYVIFAGKDVCDSRNGESLAWTGGNDTATGNVHSNSGAKISGAVKVIDGETTYRCRLELNGGDHSFTAGPTEVQAVRPWPVTFSTDDFTCDYTRAGTFDLSKKGEWWVDGSSASGQLNDGVYCATGSNGLIKLNGSGISGNVTFIAAQIQITGNDLDLASRQNGVVLFATGDDKKAIQFSGSSGALSGILYAPAGGIDLTGSKTTIQGSVVGWTVKIAGSQWTFNDPVEAATKILDTNVADALVCIYFYNASGENATECNLLPDESFDAAAVRLGAAVVGLTDADGDFVAELPLSDYVALITAEGYITSVEEFTLDEIGEVEINEVILTENIAIGGLAKTLLIPDADLLDGILAGGFSLASEVLYCKGVILVETDCDEPTDPDIVFVGGYDDFIGTAGDIFGDTIAPELHDAGVFVVGAAVPVGAYTICTAVTITGDLDADPLTPDTSIGHDLICEAESDSQIIFSANEAVVGPIIVYADGTTVVLNVFAPLDVYIDDEETGQPITGAEVCVFEDGDLTTDPICALTDTDGVAHLFNVDDGVHTLNAAATGYEAEAITVAYNRIDDITNGPAVDDAVTADAIHSLDPSGG